MYNETELWQMFLSHISSTTDEDFLHSFAQLNRDRTIGCLHDRDLRAKVKNGNYGEKAKDLWFMYVEKNS